MSGDVGGVQGGMRMKLSGHKTSLYAAAVLFRSSSPGRAGTTSYVDQNDTGLNDGTSWMAAYTAIQSGLSDPGFSTSGRGLAFRHAKSAAGSAV